MGTQDLLRQISFFESLSEENLKALADICLTKRIAKKEILFLEGEKGVSLYILLTGNIQLYKTAPDGKEIVIKVVKTGEMFGEVILFEKSAYPVSAVALKESRALMISKHQFSCLLSHENFRNEFIGSLMEKLRYLADQIRHLSHLDVENRFFLFLKEQYGERQQIRITISKKDVAAAIGATPETLSRLIQKLKKEGKITWEGSTITLKSPNDDII